MNSPFDRDRNVNGRHRLLERRQMSPRDASTHP